MSTAATVMSVLGLLLKLVRDISEDVRNGVSDDEIRKRLADPNGVGQQILDEIRSNKSKFRFPGD